MRDRILTLLFSLGVSFGVVRWEERARSAQTLEVDRLVVRHELIVSDTGQPWERGFEQQQIPRGVYARSLGDGPGGLWVRSRLIKGEIDDPFDDRFHALEKDASLRRAPGHISWNVWLDGAWRQLAIIQGEGVEWTELAREKWDGTSHPGRLRFQTYRPRHGEPLTDLLVGQGGMSVGGGGYGGGGLPLAGNVLEVWGGGLVEHPLTTPTPPRIVSQEEGTAHAYAIVAVSPFGLRSPPSASVHTRGRAVIEWDSVPGADSYIVERDGKAISGLLRIEGAMKRWSDPVP
ncbi:MAG: hypothetical protein U0794_05145 [Isosphaeraceae bacterium]